MRLVALAAATAAALAACGSGGSPSGRGAGEACSSATQCADGLVCFEAVCAASYPAAPACATAPGTPALVVGDAPAAVDPGAGACVTVAREPVPPADVADGAFLDLGDHVVGQELTLEVPAGVSSLTIVSQDVGAATAREIFFRGFRLPNTVVPTQVLLPGGQLFFSDTDPYPVDARGYDDVTGVLAYYAGFTALSGSFTIPNTAAALDLVRTAGEVPPGAWRFTVNDWAQECLSITGCTVPSGTTPGAYRVHAYARPGPVESTGTLDLEIYLATSRTGALATAAAARANAQMARFVDRLGAQFARAGICLGAVTFRDLPDWARDRFAPGGVVDISTGPTPGCDDLSQLFTVAVAPSRAVHLFLADELRDPTSSGPGLVLGIDGSIPGPSGVPGTIHGGAIVGLFDQLGVERTPGACGRAGSTFDCGTDVLAYVAAHEAGHWLGLYHTTEAFGVTFDPLSDTGTCPCLACAPAGERAACAETGAANPAPVDAASCGARETPLTEVISRGFPRAACSGARNLMFWQFDPSRADGELTRQQGEVMRLNPAVR